MTASVFSLLGARGLGASPQNEPLVSHALKAHIVPHHPSAGESDGWFEAVGHVISSSLTWSIVLTRRYPAALTVPYSPSIAIPCRCAL